MNQKTFTPAQFQKYTKLKPPSVLKIYIAIITGSFLASLATFTITTPIRNDVMLLSSPINFLIESVVGLIFFIPTIILLLWLYKSVMFSKLKRRSLISTFQHFGWSDQNYPKIEESPIIPSSIVHNLNLENNWQVPEYLRLLGELDDSPAECVWLDARYFNTGKAYVYCHVALNTAYPHTIVDGKDGLFQNDLPIHKGNVERVSLEGNLFKYFNVYTIKNAGQKALYTLSPNVLEKLYDYGSAFNVEVIGNSLYIFSQPQKLETSQGFANFMNVSLFLTRALNRNYRNSSKGEQRYRYISDYAQKRMDITTSVKPMNRDSEKL